MEHTLAACYTLYKVWLLNSCKHLSLEAVSGVEGWKLVLITVFSTWAYWAVLRALGLHA